DRNREKHGSDDEFRGGREEYLQVLKDRSSGVDRHAPVAAKEVRDVGPVLNRQRLVEPELLRDCRDLLGSRAGSGGVADRIARQKPGDDEQDDRQSDQDRHQEEDTSDRISKDHPNVSTSVRQSDAEAPHGSDNGTISGALEETGVNL